MKMLSRQSILADDFLKSIAPLWVGGLVSLCLFLGNLIFRRMNLQGERYEWALYLTLGTVFPLLVLLICWVDRSGYVSTSIVRAVKLGLVLSLAVLSVRFVVEQHQYYVLIIAAAQLAMTVSIKAKQAKMKPYHTLVCYFVLVVAWTASVRFLYWEPFKVWTFSSNYRFLLFILSLFIVATNISRDEEEPYNSSSRIWSAENIAAVLLFGMASLRSDQLFDFLTSYNHWGVFVGPAQMIRQGGWLLWDVPSQYGFLSILTLAFFPARSVWQAMFILNALLLFLSAVFIFFVLRSLRPGPGNFWFSLVVTFAAVFLMPGLPNVLTGPQVVPSIGAFRFFWCYCLLAVLVWEHRRNSDAEPKPYVLLLGCLTWVLGTLWSVESATYCAAIWLPAYILIVLRRHARGYAEQNNNKASLYRVAAWLAVPPVLLLMSLGVITSYYLVRLRHAPDWYGFYECAFSFTSGYMTLPIDPHGPVWTLILVFGVLTMIAVYFLRQGITHSSLALITGAWGALWATSSYFVSRSHGSNATNQSAILLAAGGITLFLLKGEEVNWWRRLAEMSLVPVIVVILTATFGNGSYLASYLSSPQIGYRLKIDSKLPVVDSTLVTLLRTAHVESSDPLIFDDTILLPALSAEGNNGVELRSPPQAWLPTVPFELFAHIKEDRSKVYLSRFIARRPLSGWLIQRKDHPYTDLPWLADSLKLTHTPTRMAENADWQIIWFDYNQKRN